MLASLTLHVNDGIAGILVTAAITLITGAVTSVWRAVRDTARNMAITTTELANISHRVERLENWHDAKGDFKS